MITIDGSFHEGGGQILRTALALSTLTQKPFTINNIRKNRPKPGLKHQHLYCIKALEELSGAKVDNANLGSESITFFPGLIKSRTLSLNIETAGSITLLLQSLFLPCLFANGKVRLKITGGTDVRWAIPYDYFEQVFLPHMRKFAEIKPKCIQRGYYPKGQGKVDIIIHPKYKLSGFDSFEEFNNQLQSKIKPIDLVNQGNIMQIKGISHASFDLQKAHVAERQAKTAKHILARLGCPVSIDSTYGETASTGSGITIWAKFSKEEDEIDYNNPVIIGADSLGERGKRAEDVGKEAAEQLVKEIEAGAAADSHLADNLIPYLALLGGKVKTSEISGHTATNIYTTKRFIDTDISSDEGNKAIETQ